MNISQKKLEKSKGRLEIKIRDQNLQKLYQQGSLKALMPDFHENLKQLMLINTAGGITSGDEYDYEFEIDSSNLCISTQAAEKIYSGFGNPANLEINVNLLNNSNLFWLPKELILFNNCNLKRKINFNLSKDSNLLLCENIIFGRTSMKETDVFGGELDPVIFSLITKCKAFTNASLSSPPGTGRIVSLNFSTTKFCKFFFIPRRFLDPTASILDSSAN